MEKEKLTNELILKDIQYSKSHYEPKKDMQMDNFIFYGSQFLILLIFYFTWVPYVFFLELIPIGFFAIHSMLKGKNVKQLSEKDFSVYTDRLASVQETFIDVGGKYGRYQKRVSLYFEGGSEWEIPYTNYAWSKTFKMSRNGVNNTSIQGDRFYLVRLNDTGKIAVAYNEKFFSYQKI